ncbi:Origin recognition complex subunit 2 [Hypocenomyce scalaris]|nr:Origin recognition complex subunit 2 [Hypocenomyce scalaris]
MTTKRKRENGGLDEDGTTSTPKKARTVQSKGRSVVDEHVGSLKTETPTKRPRGRPPGSTTKPKSDPNGIETPKAVGKKLFTTPSKSLAEGSPNGTISLDRNADRSARRKSARTIIERTITGDISDDNDLDEEDTLARQIWDADEPEEEGVEAGLEDQIDVGPSGPTTPSKRGPGRPKGARRKRSPTPPQNLPPHERYFLQNRPGGIKTSNSTLSNLSLLSHDEYRIRIAAYTDPHASELSFLQVLHSRSFPQWHFEFSQSFNVCLYGWGSKRRLVTSFATYLHDQYPATSPPKILVVNGYTPTLTPRTILTTVASAFSHTLAAKLPSAPTEILDAILTHFRSHPPSQPLYLFVNSLDAAPLRRSQPLLARLASCSHVYLLATCDTPNFPLLWDGGQRELFNWVFHDTTTFETFDGAEIMSVVDDVNELIGRTGRTVKGKEGVGFVLRSLPENARNLYRVLVAEALAGMDDGVGGGGDAGASDEEDDNGDNGEHGTRRTTSNEEGAVEYRVLYQKAVEEFICSSEMAFRTLLKEFHDHQMIVSRKDGTGTEMLGVPFRREEMEAILEDLMG